MDFVVPQPRVTNKRATKVKCIGFIALI